MIQTRTLDRRMVKAAEQRAIPAPHQATVYADDAQGVPRRLVVVAYTVSDRGGEAHVLLPDGQTAPVSALEEVGLVFRGVQVDAEVAAADPLIPLPADVAGVMAGGDRP